MSWKDIMKRKGAHINRRFLGTNQMGNRIGIDRKKESNSKMVSFAIRNGLDPYTTTKDGKKELKTSETLEREARQKNADRKRER